jgi:hypothetical protein
VTAFSIVKQVTEGAKAEPEKNPAAGAMGGLKGGKARAEKLTPDQRSLIAKESGANAMEA